MQHYHNNRISQVLWDTGGGDKFNMAAVLVKRSIYKGTNFKHSGGEHSMSSPCKSGFHVKGCHCV